MKRSFFITLFVAIAFSAMAQQWDLDFGDQNDINQHSRIDAGMIDTNEDAVLIGRFGRRRDWNTQLIKLRTTHLRGFAGNAIVYGCRSVEERQLFHSRYFKIRHNND